MSTVENHKAKDAYFNAEHRRVMQVLMGAWDEKDNEKKNALWRVADCEDVLWLCAAWSQYDEHDVVVDISGTDSDELSSTVDGKICALVTNTSERTTTSENFLYKCTSLTAVDLSYCSKGIEAIESGFLSSCDGLLCVDFSRMTALKSIQSSFLSSCTSLVEADFSGLNNVEEIDSCFLEDCTSLLKVDLSHMKKLKKIEGSFLSGCTGLVEANFTGLKNVAQIDATFFMSSCSSVATVRFPSCHENLEDLLYETFVGDWSGDDEVDAIY